MADEITNRLIGTRDVLVARREQLTGVLDGIRGQIADIDRQLLDCAAAGRVFGVEIEIPATAPRRSRPAMAKTIKTMVWERVQSHQGGFRVRDHRSEIEREYGRPVHDKTIGIALGRLKKDGLVRRDRHEWFATKAA